MSHRSRTQTPRAARPVMASLLGAVFALALVASSAFAGAQTAPDHTRLDALLQRYVSAEGVDYAAWHDTEKDRRALWDYVEHLEGIPISGLREEPGGREEALAYWINLYNAATLQLILGRYPVDSIKDLGGFLSSPWDKELVEVEGRKLTLNQIENDIIRPQFQEPRIHFALNCAAKSCPPLRAGAFFGPRLEEQLEEQARTFLGNADFNRIEDDGTYRLSKIFDWYRDDFKAKAGSVPAYVAPYLPGGGEKAKVKHFGYDWDLNDTGK